MRKIAVICLFFILSNSLYAQENSLVVRYDFTEKSSPPMVPFYLRIYVNDILKDSTKPHMPHHNLANAVRIPLEKGHYTLKVEGVTLPKDGNPIPAMEWVTNLEISKGKSRIHLKLKGNYQVGSTTINY